MVLRPPAVSLSTLTRAPWPTSHYGSCKGFGPGACPHCEHQHLTWARGRLNLYFMLGFRA